MVVADSGEITNSVSSVPLRVQLQLSDQLLDGRIHSFQKSARTYAFLSRRISTDAPSGLIIAFDEIHNSSVRREFAVQSFRYAGACLLALVGYSVIAIRTN